MRPIYFNLVPKNYGHHPAQSKPISILLVEDTRSDVMLVRHMLLEASPDMQFHVTDVPRLKEALETLDKNTFDIILLDLNLLDASGVTCIAALHAEIATIPIIVFSASNDPALKEQVLLCGARHCLVKGLHDAFLLGCIEQSLVSHESRNNHL